MTDPFEALLAEAARISDQAPAVGPIARRVPEPGDAPCGGRFQIVRRLGEGGMGAVFEALDRERGEHIALKCLRSGQAGTLIQLKREFRALADLEHPNLARLHGLHADDDLWFFTMELVPGVPFDAHVRAHPGALRDALAQLIAGLALLHRAGLVHRDIKPSNVLVEPGGRVVVLDFGLVTAAAAPHEGDPVVAGTPRYMAPEQAAGEGVGPPADIYGAGILLAESLTDADGDLAVLATRMIRAAPDERPTADELLALLAPAAPVSPAEQDFFLGRDAELEELRVAVATVEREGRAAVLHVIGESGVGKSTLLRQLGATLGPSAHVLRGGCRADEDIPFRAADGLIDDLATHLRRRSPAQLARLLPHDAARISRLFPVLVRLTGVPGHEGAGREQELRAQAFRALGEVLARLAREKPVVLVVDDVQWADPDSLDLFEIVARTPAPILLVLAGRERAEAVARLPARQTLELGPLALEHARRLARLQLGHAPEHERVAEAVAAEASGHPLYIVELARLSGSSGGRSPGRVEDAIRNRVAELADEERRLLRLVCLAGVIGRRELRDAIGGDPSSLLRRRLVRVGRRNELEPYHDRVRDTVHSEIELPERTALHGAIADVLARHDADPERLARHSLGAGRLADAAAAFERAAVAARHALAFDHAARLYEQAAALCTATCDRHRLQAAQAAALAAAGQAYRAAQVYGALGASSDNPEAREHAHLAAEYLIRSGRFREGFAATAATLREIAISLPATRAETLRALVARRTWLRLRGLGFRERREAEVPPAELRRLDLLWATSLSLAPVDGLLGADVTIRHCLQALRTGERRRVARALALETVIECVQGADPRWVTRLRDRVRDACARVGDPESLAWGHTAAGIVAWRIGRWAEGIAEFDAAEDLLRAQCPDAVFFINNAALYGLFCRWHAGRLDELRGRSQRLLDEASDRDDLHMRIFLESWSQPLLALVEDRPDRAEHALAWYAAHVEQTGSHLHFVFALYSRVLLDLRRGDPEAAVRRFDAPAAEGARRFLERVAVERVFSSLLRATAHLALAASHPSALDEVPRAARALERERLSWARPLASLVRGQLAGLRGETAAAARLLAAARAGFAAHGMALFEAAAAHALGAPAPAGASTAFGALLVPIRVSPSAASP